MIKFCITTHDLEFFWFSVSYFFLKTVKEAMEINLYCKENIYMRDGDGTMGQGINGKGG